MAKRIAIVERDRCFPERCGNYLCAKLCPVNRTGKDCITPGEEDKKARIDESLCTGCGICPKRCPFEAIKIINLPEALDTCPLHRYGENMFELFSIPTPLFGLVNGIIGKNGIGKSTAMKIVSGTIKPNFGKAEESRYEDIIHHFRGSEIQSYFEKMHLGEVDISYKPQQIELIPKAYKGKVYDLLKHADARGEIDKIMGLLDITQIKESSLSDISGGELQRVAIAASILKKWNMMIMDEPSSFLDIKQRLNMGRMLKNLVTDEKGILLVEHDLIILDYMCDNIQVMYGQESAYGVLSGVKSVREGVNAFLEGFLKEENIRFRDHPIRFEKNSSGSAYSDEEIVRWDELDKTVGKFSLSTSKGVIHKGEIIGILGENGIGKTTFVKILAGKIKQDSGGISKEVRLSYKPQYIKVEEDDTVMNFLKEAISNHHNQLIKPLSIGPIYNSMLSNLSGGELQRVFIAKALSEDADLYLLDEPSAYLDAEQRLLLSRIIRNIAKDREVSFLVVDHDLLFLDYLSDSLFVFEGTPAVDGRVDGPFSKEEGMNRFLRGIGITFRRDPESNRPRANKIDSVKDREQKEEGKYYYV